MDNTEPTRDLYQKITDICFENGGATKPMVDKLYELISDQVAKARIDERSQAQQYLHGLTITPENQHLFDVLSRNNHNRIAELKGVKNK